VWWWYKATLTGDVLRFLEEEDEGECVCLREDGGDVATRVMAGTGGVRSFVRFTDLAVRDARQRSELVGYLKSGLDLGCRRILISRETVGKEGNGRVQAQHRHTMITYLPTYLTPTCVVCKTPLPVNSDPTPKANASHRPTRVRGGSVVDFSESLPGGVVWGGHRFTD
jgi:hypothetical protein